MTERRSAPAGSDRQAGLPAELAGHRGCRARDEAVARWRAACGGAALPPLSALVPAGTTDPQGVVLVAPEAAGDVTPPCPADGSGAEACRRAVLARWADVAAAAAPLVVDYTDGAGEAWRGVALPYGGPDGRIGAVQLLVRHADLPDAADLRGVARALAGISEVVRTPVDPWRLPESGAVRLLGRADPEPRPAALAAARTWAALAAAGPAAGRRACRQSALVLLLRCLRAGDVADPAAAVAAAFGTGLAAGMKRDLVDTLAHGAELGLGEAAFAALLCRATDGPGTLAREARDGRAEDVDRHGSADIPAAGRLELTPLPLPARPDRGGSWRGLRPFRMEAVARAA